MNPLNPEHRLAEVPPDSVPPVMPPKPEPPPEVIDLPPGEPVQVNPAQV